jgi:hypothetical protein
LIAANLDPTGGLDPVGSLADLLDLLDQLAVELNCETSRLVVTAPVGVIDSTLDEAIHTHRTMLVVIVRGRESGHVPAVCTHCREVTMTSLLDSQGRRKLTLAEAEEIKRQRGLSRRPANGRWPACRMTPGCPGSHVVRPADLDGRVAPVPAPAIPTLQKWQEVSSTGSTG